MTASDRAASLAGLVLLALAAVAWALVVAPVAGGASEPARSAGAGVGAGTGAVVAGDATRGQALFLQSCASCHGEQGTGTPVAPSIRDAGPALADYVLRTGRMPLNVPSQQSRRNAPAFDEAQIADLVAYVASLGTGPPIPEVAVSGADVALGRSLYIENCASCHGAGGAGGAVGAGFVAPPLSASDPTTVGEAVTVGPGPMPVFAFTPAERDALAAYVQELRNPPSPGGLAVADVGPVAEGFLAGTVGIVTLLVIVRSIARGRPAADDERTE
ncbi:MAG TPA: c-type cytochrome, partial [Candidatus Limnocylindrales bacterium]